MLRHFSEIEGCKVVAGVDIAEARLKDFCDKHKIPRYFTDLDEAIAWGEFDAVTNVTPDAVHYPTHDDAHRGRQADLLREAAGAELSAGAGNDGGGEEGAASSTW